MMLILWFIKRSIYLDLVLWKVSGWNFWQKIEFLFKKYLLIFLLQSNLRKFKLNKSFTYLFKKKIFYDSPYGLASYQSILTRHKKMIDYAKINKVKTVVDVGANVGFFSLMIRDLFPKAKIYAIEPVPLIFSCLKNNLNGSLDRVFNLAMSNKKSVLKMAFDEQECILSYVVTSGKEKKSEAVIEVIGETLDKFSEDNKINLIDILKIDTECFEQKVLQGAKETLSRTRYLHLEISIENNKNYTFSQINSLLYSEEYNFQLLCFRNYLGKGDGPLPVVDFLYKNILLK